ncbi:ATP-dependent zinc protease family protein [Vibrio agarivorans]|uniref:ATP-dependent zinc protease n=1 Tax=Vibrio agarivorans TaxID=153622 RepID=A0ABT7Y6A3_9VIBR|nr:ATP-dependent zinc protease [Vibrio agarivorans]MDN2483577.1 ATP-dependent zinc protease [Vibrio agarivorans]
MNKSRQLLLTLLLTGGLVACTTTPPQPIEPDTPEPEIEQPIEQPDVELPIEPEVEQPVEPVEPEVKPEPKPEPKPLPVKTEDGKLILGDKEWVFFPGLKQHVKARIDTGATTSSISAVDIVPFERDGKDWVKFKIQHDGVKTGELEAPIQRWVKIKQSSEKDETQRRAVVSGWIQIGDLKEQTEFTLTDRTHMDFPVLLGRSFFNDVALIDTSRSYVQGKSKI